jgi:hypothetical protein
MGKFPDAIHLFHGNTYLERDTEDTAVGSEDVRRPYLTFVVYCESCWAVSHRIKMLQAMIAV